MVMLLDEGLLLQNEMQLPLGGLEKLLDEVLMQLDEVP
jgi:hypothetical protein